MLDVEDLIPGPYRLEVSSPGLDRKLVKLTDYERFAGKKARIKLRHPLQGRKQFTGKLRGCGDGAVALESDGGVMRFRLEDIELARLVAEF
jgi:ribosome maturation factor RimP